MKAYESNLEHATFAGGCFWCMVTPFEKKDGIIKVISGYMGGNKENPTYEEVCSHQTGHLEVVQITYDPNLISYDQLLDIYWQQIDPTDPGGQFHDRGESYQTAIFYHNEEQRQKAEASKKALTLSKRFQKPIVTLILPATTFYPAEEYHQKYHKKKPIQYALFRYSSGRDSFIKKNWSSPDPKLKEKLTELQYYVTQENGTEPPFQNEYWDNNREGVYVDIISGEPLFSSLKKFKSESGWPSFTEPINPMGIKENIDLSHGLKRIEVRSKKADAHLGHVFPDGPGTNGLRYCINSAALRFIAKEDLEHEGYGELLTLFEKGVNKPD